MPVAEGDGHFGPGEQLVEAPAVLLVIGGDGR
jgi:hypothetical protein